MCFINCCRTERNQPITFAQETWLFTYCKTFSSLTANEFIHNSYVIKRQNQEQILLGHIVCFGRCGLSMAYFTEMNEWMNESWTNVVYLINCIQHQLSANYIRPSSFLCCGPDDLDLTTDWVSWPVSVIGHFLWPQRDHGTLSRSPCEQFHLTLICLCAFVTFLLINYYYLTFRRELVSRVFKTFLFNI